MTSPVDTSQATDALSRALAGLALEVPGLELRAPSAETLEYAVDFGTRGQLAGRALGPAVALPTSVEEVQALVVAAAAHGVEVVPRGAGSGLSGGATAEAAQLVISTERLDRILEVNPLDEVAVVEPGVINAALNAHLASYGLFYAPDPASWDISSIGGNIATNAGGLRCAKYGVTRESVLSLDVVLADGTLLHTGHRSIKGVTGLDLVSLFVGSEGTLGIVVRATVRLRPIPVARRTVSAFFASTAAGAGALSAITRSSVRPSVIEFFDEPSLANIDAFTAAGLLARGSSLILVELDGYGIDEQTADLERALVEVGGVVTVETPAAGEILWELRRSGRGFDPAEWATGGDMAVPKSRIPEMYAHFPLVERRYGVTIGSVAHAGDGNLHPMITLRMPEGADPHAVPHELHAAAEELAAHALRLGGTVSGEHGIGSLKLDYAALELTEHSRALQLAVKRAFDPASTFNPGKAL